MMDRQAAPSCIGEFGPARHRFNEIAMIELDLEGHLFEVLGSQFERGLGQIDTVIVADLCIPKRAHLACVAASNIKKGEGHGKGLVEGVMQKLADRFMGEPIRVHDLLVGRPLFLELLECGLIYDRTTQLKLMDQNVDHCAIPKNALDGMVGARASVASISFDA